MESAGASLIYRTVSFSAVLEAILPSITTTSRRIGLLGGSFNPPHKGHREISLAALERLGLDAVWWLVSPGNPLKDLESYAPFDARLRAARKMADHPDIVVSDFERRHGLQYTVDTLERLQMLNPETRFVWLMGADSLHNFHRWKNWRRIAEMTAIAVFNRPGHDIDESQSVAAKELALFRIEESAAEKLIDAEPPAWVFFSDTNNPMSSTAIRRAAKKTTETPEN